MNELKAIVILFAAVFVVGCSPQRKMARLIAKHPQLIEKVDTSVTYDTTITIRNYDTSLVFNSQLDTVMIYNENVVTRIIRHQDSIFITQETIDTLITEKVIIERHVVAEKPRPWWWYVVGTIAALFLILWARSKLTKH